MSSKYLSHDVSTSSDSETEKARSEQSPQRQGGRMTLRNILVMTSIAGVYFATIVHITGSGLLAQTIAKQLGGPSLSTWLSLGITIPPACLGPSISLAADFWGRKWMVVGCMLMGFTGALIVSRSEGIAQAIAGQVIAGFAQPGQALVHAIISEITPRKYRPYAQMTLMISVGLGAVTSLYVAGALAQNNPDGFRNFMYFAAALYFTIAAIMAVMYTPALRTIQHLTLREKLYKFDIGGSLLTLIGFLDLCIGLGWSNNPYPWTSARVLAPFLIGIVCILALPLYSTFINPDGIWHRDFFHSRNFAIGMLCIFFEGFLFFGFVNYFPYQIAFLYQKNLFDTALETSIAFYFVPIGGALAGAYAAQTKTLRVPLVTSFIFMVCFYGPLAATGLSDNTQLWGLGVFFGLALGTATPIVVTLVQLSVPAELISTVSGLVMATRAIGGTLGLAVFAAIFNSAVKDNFAPKVAAAALPLGLPQSSLGPLLGTLSANDQAALQHIPGVTPQIIQASFGAMLQAFHIAFRNVYIMCAALAAFAIFVSIPLKEPKAEFTDEVDEPLFEGKPAMQHGGSV
ncbi:hypothetical protein PRZ48_006752 [Zasmidium cellare]|uniref:Major facilitator superfamily (MFS) profile domain-containing protein n=1 Tax=Zasmidium cellare TaxID=395010 RepID=A0ABR0EI79_ZASCE|nr:hypothetical protein PRZ48_006752 [Zasmidium cellare]